MKISLIQKLEKLEIFWKMGQTKNVWQIGCTIYEGKFNLNPNILPSILFMALFWVFHISALHKSNITLFCHMSPSFKKCPQPTDGHCWHHPVKVFSWNSRSLDISSYLGSDSSAKPSGSQRSRKSEACNYWNRPGLPWGKCGSFAVCCNCVTY